ncbi:MAG: hypothetical protein QM749_15550 [Aquabacterium sp.]
MQEILGFELDETVEPLVSGKAQRLNDRAMYSIRQRHAVSLNCFPVTMNFYLGHVWQCGDFLEEVPPREPLLLKKAMPRRLPKSHKEIFWEDTLDQNHRPIFCAEISLRK